MMPWRLGGALAGLSLLVVTGCKSSPPPKPIASNPRETGPDYRDIASEAGLRFSWKRPAKKIWSNRDAFGSGCAFLDYDQDGWMDVFLAGQPHCALFRNRGDGTLEDVTRRSGITRGGEWSGVAVGDYDNDGFPDVYVAGFHGLMLLHNESGRAFSDRSAASGLQEKEWGTSSVFFDADVDGDLDLLVGHYVITGGNAPEYCPGVRRVLTGCPPMVYLPQFPKLYQNDGHGRFSDVSLASGFGMAHGKSLALQVADYDDDGLPDVYIANDGEPADLFHNVGHGRFENQSMQTGTAMGMGGEAQAGMGVDFGDYDRDGLLDLVVTTFRNETYSLYHNTGGTFEPASHKSGLEETKHFLGFGTRFFDYDDDSWPDLVFANGHVYNNVEANEPDAAFRQPPLLFHNQRGTYSRVLTGGPGLQKTAVGRGLAIGDLRNDGGQDLLIVDCDGAPLLLRNKMRTANHWLGVELRGVHGNRDGYGARVTVKWPGGESYRDLSGGGSYLSVSDPRLHFGLGRYHGPVEVQVRWPGRSVNTYLSVSTDRYVRLAEGSDRYVVLSPGFPSPSWPGVQKP